ncbi:serine/threonine-protein kinase [Paractinoplanes rishiriensis]|uniref:non-specific serine/threonine protein kinase n=1 Tax=Paractinoplanes rishiriensis TaxID=1050105 RepID=A0A919MYH3_9ACTN|nr:serine/threonine-protein kinase [Actinoplanes rishiriensis]GIF00194.1 hypothetical protein Ari01nite_76580 [Actinoplanes rishiriensis]
MTEGQVVAGRYRVVRPLAAGGLSRVWLAADQMTGDPVALKRCELPPGLTPDEQDLFRVWTVREARAFAVVRHPNVIRTLDVVPDDDAPWIVMEYLPSRSLQQVVDESGPLPPARVAGIGLAVLEGLLAIVRAGLLHLDVKPGNVLIADDGRVVLTDSGPAVTTEGVRALARAGIILGSPKYLAPERLMSGVATAASDLWSLGATLYHAVEGRPPYQRPTTVDMLLALSEDPPDPPVRAGVLTPVLEALLCRDPSARPAPDEVRAMLREPPGVVQPVPVPRRRRVAVLALALALLTPVAAVPLTWPESPPEARPVQAAAPDGFVWYDPMLYRVAVPAGWISYGDGRNGLVATAGTGQPSMRLTLLETPPDPLAEERATRLPGYRRIRIERLPGSRDSVWEYTYRDAKRGEMHGRLRIFRAGSLTYTLDWRTPRDEWTAQVPALTTVVDSFTAKAAR